MPIKDEPKQRLPRTLIATYTVKEMVIWNVDLMDENAVKRTLSGAAQDFIEGYKKTKHYNTGEMEHQDMADRYGTILDKTSTNDVKKMYLECFNVNKKGTKAKKEMLRMLVKLLVNREK